MPLEGAGGLAPSAPPTAMGTAWGAATPSMDSHSSGPVGWNERNDVEYWLPDNLNSQIPVFEYPGSNVYLKPSLPSIIQPVPDAAIGLPQEAQPMQYSPSPNVSSMHSDNQDSEASWPSTINEANMIPWIDVYFDRLHPTIPVLSRSSLYTSMLTQEHRKNPQFGAMLLSLCAFSLTQPIEIDERPTTSSRALQARAMMNEATKMRSCSDFGENPTIEAVLTSFFLFGCLFGSNQHNAAWLRMREALDLAATLGLNDPESYHDLPGEEKGQRLRTYLVLSITERFVLPLSLFCLFRFCYRITAHQNSEPTPCNGATQSHSGVSPGLLCDQYMISFIAPRTASYRGSLYIMKKMLKV